MKLAIVKPKTTAEKRTSSALDTIEITEAVMGAWKAPPFQRPLRVNEKLQAIAKLISEDGVIPGVITIGVLDGDAYILDGQHRSEAYRMSGLPVAYADVRYLHCSSMAHMGEEFVNLNSRIVSIRPDDILRGLEGTYAPLRAIRERCKFVGYDMIRRNDKAPIVSMSMALRVWRGSAAEVPAHSGQSAAALAQTITDEEAEQLASFLTLCYQAWGRDPQFRVLWNTLNLMLCAWMFRRLVISQHSPKTPRLNRELFCKCLMSLSAESQYVDWLVGRKLSERDRSPAYARLKKIFSVRLASELGHAVKLPAPAWANE